LEIWYLIIVYFVSPHGRKKNTNRKHIKATQWREEGEEENQISFVYIK
jgi:hypothetical protein